jgi:hypothetical protein
MASTSEASVEGSEEGGSGGEGGISEEGRVTGQSGGTGEGRGAEEGTSEISIPLIESRGIVSNPCHSASNSNNGSY